MTNDLCGKLLPQSSLLPPWSAGAEILHKPAEPTRPNRPVFGDRPAPYTRYVTNRDFVAPGGKPRLNP